MKLKVRSVFLIGILVAVLPFLGFPGSWKTVFFIILGLLNASNAYFLHTELKSSYKSKVKKETVTHAFVENHLEK